MDLVSGHCRYRYWITLCYYPAATGISVVEPMFALVFVLVPLAAVLILGEHLPPLRIVGLVLIFVGVILVGQTA